MPIETPEGKAAYLERQRAFAERSNALRRRLLDVLDAALPVTSTKTIAEEASSTLTANAPR